MLVRLVASVLLLAASSGPSLSAGSGHAVGAAEHVSELDGVRIIHAWTRATSTPEALVYLELENRSGRTVSLIGGESESGSAVTLVGLRFRDGAAELVTLPAVPVKDGAELHLDPEGLALRVEGLKEPLHPGDVIEIEVRLESGHVDVDVEVEAADATGHSHAGHAH
ncbi:hypothetical protein DFR52_10467 [Hoeflea marina]|uniref:Copper(I)-binding protein n=1 Tax=Hoeflea marina TaxID=274592 RepID=A0A317PH54_9HYPH|nr:copper chaperone PCu(A)C [Hoeflea marina]PWV98778.1 hypothetical protein DFR52_10467 [Hoeflea marina]